MSTDEIPNPLGLDLTPLELDQAPIDTNRGVHYRGDKPNLIKLWLVSGLLGLVTFGLYTPWGVHKILKVIIESFEIGGRRPSFEATPIELLLQCLKLSVLSMITLGIYAPWAAASYFKFIAEKTTIDGIPFELDARGADLFRLGLFALGLSIPTLGIYGFFFAEVRLWRYLASRTQHGDRVLDLSVQGTAWFKHCLPGFLLTVLTLGIYAPWAVHAALQWLVERLEIRPVTAEASPDESVGIVPGFAAAVLSAAAGIAFAVVLGLGAARFGETAMSEAQQGVAAGKDFAIETKGALEKIDHLKLPDGKTYVWKDKKGQTHITSDPPPDGAKLIKIQED